MSSHFDLNFTPINDEMEFLFDRNEIPTDDVRELLFDLNTTPPNEENSSDEDDAPVDNDQTNFNENHVVNSEMDQVQESNETKGNLSNTERWAIYNALLQKSCDGKLKKTTTREVSDMFSVPILTVQRIWKRAKETPIGEYVNVSHKRSKRCGRKRVPLDVEKIAETDLRQRTNLRSLSVAASMKRSTLHRRFKEGMLRHHTNAIKPSLKDENIRSRLEFCFSMLEKDSLSHQPRFVDMYNTVHIDEKWFYMTKQMEKYYLLPGEEDAYRSCQSKNYICKVMFLAAMARPRFDEDGNETFDGKIGVFPFAFLEPAKRRSKHRDAGTMELKASTFVKRQDIKSCLIEKVIPRIHERWPMEDRHKTIFIQQDNARTHVAVGDKEFEESASKNGFDIRLMCQPPNSPGLNILDLGFFNAIQTLQYKECPTTVQELVHAVEKSFDAYSPKLANFIFLTLQSCMKEIMKIGGSNNYKIPHMGKYKLNREGRLPIQVSCDVSLVQTVMNTLASSE